ncbi:zinc finger, CCHC-type containing protein [Tanacetum coccineum]
MFDKSPLVYYVTYVSEAFFVQDDDVAWWVDSGATVHVCKDGCWFKTYESLNDGSILHMGNESTALVHGRGCVDLRFSSRKVVSLLNVLHVPNIRKNLVSSSVLNNCGFKQVIESNKFVLSKHGVFIGFGYQSNHMFRLNIVSDNIGSAFMSTSKLNDSILWHARLGHSQVLGFLMETEDIWWFMIFEEVTEEQALKQWHQKFNEVVLSNSYLLNQDDKCVYSKFDETGKGVIIYLYVDDMLIFGTNQVQVDMTKEFLLSRFFMKDMGKADVILGIRIKHESYIDASWISNTEDNSSTSEFEALAACYKKLNVENFLLEFPLWPETYSKHLFLLL